MWRAEQEVLISTAKVYLGQSNLGELKTLIERIDKLQVEEQNRSLLLAKLYNLLGYALRADGDYNEAIAAYEKARDLWRDIEDREKDRLLKQHLSAQHANTLNNLAWAYAEVGKFGRAIRLGEDALDLRVNLGPLAPIAFSYNTLGMINLRSAKPLEGRQLCELALDIFHDVELLRGVGLAEIALAEALRRSMDFPYFYLMDEKIGLLDEAATHIKNALEIFSQKIIEPLRKIEAYIEAGCIFRDWARLDRQVDRPFQVHYEQSEQYLRSAMREAENLSLVHKQLEAQVNLAWLYFYVDELDYAEKEAQAAIAAIPKTCTIGTIETREEGNKCNIWAQILGKIHLLLGEIARERLEEEYADRRALDEAIEQLLKKAGKYYALSLAYDRQYAEDFRDFRRAKDLIYENIKGFGHQRMRVLIEGVRETERTFDLTGDYAQMTALIREYFGEVI
jgi:tetratricopeptide (TPR) repeat protein